MWGTDWNRSPLSLKWIRLINSSCWMRREQQNYVLYNMHLIVMMRLHCGICPHCSWAVWRRAVCVFWVTPCPQSQLLALRSGVFVYACVLLCVGGGSGLRGDENTSPAAMRPSAHPAASSPHSAGKFLLEKLPHTAVQRTLRHADRSALTWAPEESAPAARGHRGGRRLHWINAVPPLHSLQRHTGG